WWPGTCRRSAPGWRRCSAELRGPGAGGWYGRRARAHEPADLVGGHRRAPVVALRTRAAHRLEGPDLGLVLHALGEHVEAERTRQADDRGHDRVVLGVGAEPVDEGPVDLQQVDRQPLEARERRVAGAEVV